MRERDRRVGGGGGRRDRCLGDKCEHTATPAVQSPVVCVAHLHIYTYNTAVARSPHELRYVYRSRCVREGELSDALLCGGLCIAFS